MSFDQMNLIMFRKIYKLSAADMAKRLGVSYSTYLGWEKGKSFPKLLNLALLGFEYQELRRRRPEIFKDVFDDFFN